MNKRGLLVRVGIDSTCGRWNAPCGRQTESFAYVPIPESKEQHAPLATTYGEFKETVGAFGVAFPTRLEGQATHLDPDFRHLTYGDQGQRAARINSVCTDTNDVFLVFYASLRDSETASLVYALIGFFWVEEIVAASSVEEHRWHENAHTRRKENEGEIVVRASAGKSGKLSQFIPVGHYRDRAYRIDTSILAAWGGLDVKNGYVQRSVYLPEFTKPDCFLEWFSSQNPTLVARNI